MLVGDTMSYHKLSENLQEADWKTEKHVPVIECPDAVKTGDTFQVSVSVGKEIPHPNTTEHHIRWISLFFRADGEKATYQVGHFEFTAHGESGQGPNAGPVYTAPSATATVRIDKPGTLYALVLCNIHGLWQAAKKIETQ